MNKKTYYILPLLMYFLVASNAFAKAICKVPVFYRWKIDPIYRDENRNYIKKNPVKSEKDYIKDTYWGVIVAEGEKKEDAQKNLDYMILEKQGDILEVCKSEHESYSGCISGKYKKLKHDLESSNFVVRKQIEDSIKLDCENQVGDCIEVVKKDILCEEIKEEVQEEEQLDAKSKNKKNNKKDAKNSKDKK